MYCDTAIAMTDYQNSLGKLAHLKPDCRYSSV